MKSLLNASILKIQVFLVFFFLSLMVNGQTISISDIGESGTSGNNWTIYKNILVATGDANIHPSVIEKALDIEDFSIQVKGKKGTLLIQSSIHCSKPHLLKLIAQSSIKVYTPIEIYGGEIYLSVTDAHAAQGSIFVNSEIYAASPDSQGGNIILEAKDITLSENA